MNALLERIHSGAVDDTIARVGPLEGPMTYAHVVMAMKSALAGSLEVGDGRERLKAMLPKVGWVRDRELGELVAREAGMFLGIPPIVPLAEVQRWAASMPRWFAHGKLDRMYLAELVAFHAGGESWNLIKAAATSCLQEHLDPNGAFAVTGPEGAEIANAFCVLGSEIYYRYSPNGALVSALGIHTPREADADESAVASTDAGSQGWPLRWNPGQPVQLAPRAVTEIELGRFDLKPAWSWTAVPLLGDAVWRSLRCANPTATALPTGVATVVEDGRITGSTWVPFAEPCAELEIPLGLENGIRVTATPTVSSSEGLLTRTLSVGIAYELVAPIAWAHEVAVIEPIPWGTDRVELRCAGISGRDLPERMRTDPFFHLTVSRGHPAELSYQLSYPGSMRPFLEYR